jgi:pyrophosphatase PpaX
MIREYRTYNHEHHDLLVKEFKGVNETVRTLKDSGFKLAIVSTKILDTVRKGLKLTQLDPYFDVIVALDHVSEPKPNPEAIFLALKQLNSTPEQAIMIGDNYHDILAGKNAKTTTAGVSWSLKGREFLAQYKPDYILDEMADLLKIVGE